MQSTTRYQACFEALKEKNEGAFVPFVTLGDPNLETSRQILKTLIKSGADALELGFPFSDPMADGPTIQGANVRSLASGMTIKDCFTLIHEIRDYAPKIPVGLLVYANLVYANGIDAFYQKCQAAKVDSVLIADVPVELSEPFVKAAKQYQIAPIFIAPPNGDDSTLKAVAQNSEGYTYLLSRAGVTGAETKAKMPVAALLEKLQTYQAPPAILGFGISTPEQVKEAIQSGARGVISGSAVVNIVEKYQDAPKQLEQELAQFIHAMKAATKIN